jgi:hypothetical protein
MPYKNKDDKKAQDKLYNETHREACSARDKKYHEAHKEYRNAYRRAWEQENKERLTVYYKERYQTNKEKMRWESLLRLYGITAEEYNNLFMEQEGRCAICGRHQQEFSKALFVDHNHITGEIRGLLCGNCNAMLGQAKEKEEILRKGAEYLERYANSKDNSS